MTRGAGLLGTALPVLARAGSAAEAAAAAAAGALPLLGPEALPGLGIASPTFASAFALDAAGELPPDLAAFLRARPAAVLVLPERGGDAALGLLCFRRVGAEAAAGRAVAAGADALLLDAGSDAATLAALRALVAALPLPLVAAAASPAAALAALEAGALAVELPFAVLNAVDRAALLARVGRPAPSRRAAREGDALRANLRRRKAARPG